MRKLVVVLLIAGCGFNVRLLGDSAPEDAGTDGDGDGAGGEVVMTTHYRRTIDLTDARVTGSHASFPLLVDLAGDWLGSGNGGHVGRTDGRDIRFSTDPDGAQVLVHEVELYDPTQGRLIAWVQVPTLAPSTVLYMHYGEPTAASTGDPRTVWTVAGFAGVWHLQSTADASGQNTAFSTTNTQSTEGKIVAARGFNGLDSSIDVGSNPVIDGVFVGGGTVEAWIRPTSYGENGAGRVLEKGPWLITFSGGSLRFFYDWTGSDGDWLSQATVALNEWHHVAVVYDLQTATIYLDGTASTMQTQTAAGTPLSDASATLLVGNNLAGNRTFAGDIDEVRVSSGARDAGWIATSRENQRDPAAFFTLGDEQPRP